MDEEFDPLSFIGLGDTTSTDTVDPYKQALIQKIQSGATDYTYGPGSPGATSSDMRQKKGARENPLRTGDIALPQKDYELFTPQEREKLGIADTSWITTGQPTPRGSVERYFGPEAGAFDPKTFIENKPQPSPTPASVPDVHAFLEPAAAEPEAAPTPELSTTEQVGKALGEGIKVAAQAISKSAGPVPQFRMPERQPFVIPTQQPQAPLIGQAPPPIPTQQMPQMAAPTPTPDMSLVAPLMQQMLPQPQTLPEPPPQPTFNAPVMQGTMEGLQQTVSNLIPHTMEQFHGLAQLLNAPTEPQGFFHAALQQGLVTAQIAQAAIKAGPLSKEAGLAYGTILPQVLMAAGGLGEAGAIPRVGTVARSLTGRNMLPRAQELGGIGITGGSREVPVPESFQPRGTTSENVPTDRPAPQLSEPLQFSVDMPTDTFATEQHPVSSALHEMKVMSKSGAKNARKYEGNEALWDDAPALAHPTHNKIYSIYGTMPDVAAQNLFDAGLISDPSVQAMWKAVGNESKGARSALKSQRGEAQAVGVAAKQKFTQDKAFANAEKQAWKLGAEPIAVRDLQVGDTVTVGGEQFKATDIDPDTHDVTLEDGSKYGVQSVQDGTVIYGKHESTSYAPPAATPPPRKSTTPPTQQPPPYRPVKPPPTAPQPPPKGPRFNPNLNPVSDWGPFTRTYRIDKELGELTDAVGAAPESGALASEYAHRNLTHELTPQQESDLAKLLVSDRMKGVNPQHPQVIFDSVARGIESVPAIKKALEYYRKEIEPEVEALHKRAGTSEKAIATQRGRYIALIPEKLPDGTIPQLVPTAARMSRTTKFAKPAAGNALKYSTDLKEILRESYTEPMRKAALRDLLQASNEKGVLDHRSVFVPDPAEGPSAGKWMKTLDQNDLPPDMRENLDLIARQGNTMRPIGIKRALDAYQRGATALQLGANPLEVQSHMRRQLHIVAAKPPIGMGITARLSAVLPYFGPKGWVAFKTAFSDMSTPEMQGIIKDQFSVGGGSTRAFGERYNIRKIPVLKNISEFTNKLLFSVPKGKGVMGWHIRMNALLEQIRRNAEPHLAHDKQRIRQFANQLGQYGTMKSWPIQALMHVNPYAATSGAMRLSEFKTLIGDAGFKGETLPKAALHRVETFMRGSGGTIAMLTLANKLLSGKWPWENDPKHLFDLATGVKDKLGNQIYVANRFLSPEFYRAISTMSIPEMVRELRSGKSGALSKAAAATVGPINAGLSLVGSPGLSLAAAAGPQVALHFMHDPGQKNLNLMKVGQYTNKDRARGIPPLLKRAEAVGEQVHPLIGSILGYMDEPINGLRPLGIFSIDHPRGGATSVSEGSGRGSGRTSGRGQGGR